MNAAVAAIADARVVAVLRASGARELEDRARRSLDLGVRILEVTTTCAGWDEVLADLAASSDEVVVGAGTVTTVDHATRALAAGARFLVAPLRVGDDVRSAAGEAPLIQGGFTPTEIAAVAGRWPVKLFPASTGGIPHLRALIDTQPGLRIMPTGGIRPEDIGQWLAAGAMAVGIGSALFDGDRVRVRARIAEAAR